MSSAASLVRLSGTSLRPAREGVQVTRVRMLGTWAWIVFRAARQEARRR